MFDYTTFRLAQQMADERMQRYRQREPLLVWCYPGFNYAGFKLHRPLLAHLAAVLIQVGTKLEAHFTDQPKPAVSPASS